jgi:hypothetical protein
MKKLLIALFVIGFISSCKKEDDEINTTPVVINNGGFGNSTSDLTGTTFQLPNGVTFNGQIISSGFSPCNPSYFYDVNGGELVYLSVPLKNNTNDTIVVNFPAGLVCQSEDSSIQNGIILQACTINLPPLFNSCVNFNMYCINKNRNAPNGFEIYKKPLISNNQKLSEIIQLLSTKKSTWYQDPNANIYSSNIQVAIWNVADHGSMYDSDRTVLSALPNK